MEFNRESAGEYHESMGKTKLYIDDAVVAEGPMKTQPGKFTLSGDGLCVGRDSGDAVGSECQSPGAFSGDKIDFVAVTVEDAQYLNLEKLAAAAFAVDSARLTIALARSRHRPASRSSGSLFRSVLGDVATDGNEG